MAGSGDVPFSASEPDSAAAAAAAAGGSVAGATRTRIDEPHQGVRVTLLTDEAETSKGTQRSSMFDTTAGSACYSHI